VSDNSNEYLTSALGDAASMCHAIAEAKEAHWSGSGPRSHEQCVRALRNALQDARAVIHGIENALFEMRAHVDRAEANAFTLLMHRDVESTDARVFGDVVRGLSALAHGGRVEIHSEKPDGSTTWIPSGTGLELDDIDLFECEVRR